MKPPNMLSSDVNEARGAHCWPWVPPPALTTAGRTLAAGRRRHRKSTDNPVHSGTSSKTRACRSADVGIRRRLHSPSRRMEVPEGDPFQSKLHRLLNDIRILKSSLTDNLSVENISKELAQPKKPAGALQQTQSQGEISERNVKSSHLVGEQQQKQHGHLLTKLSRIETGACEALQHAVSLRQCVDRLNETNCCSDIDRWELSDVADGAKKHSEEYVGDAPSTPAPEKSQPPRSSANSEVLAITEQVQNLQGRLSDDRKLIGELQSALRKMKSKSSAGKEDAKKIIKLHKDRADRYLASIESLNGRTSEKNKEIVALKQDVSSLRLLASQLNSEKERLEIKTSTLTNKLHQSESEQKGADPTLKLQLEELSSRFMEASAQIIYLQAERDRLQDTLTEERNREKALYKTKNDVVKKEHQDNDYNIMTPQRPSQADKCTQVFQNSDALDNKVKEPIIGASAGGDGEQWVKMFDMWQQLQNDKIMFLQSLKDLEQKLETSQQANAVIRKEITNKENTLQEITVKLENKMEENKSLQKLLESALSDTKKYGDLVKEKSRSLDTVSQSKFHDLEKLLLDSQRENVYLRKDKKEMERKFNVKITELEQRLDMAEKSKRAMNDYIAFLKSSYANVFGDGSIVK